MTTTPNERMDTCARLLRDHRDAVLEFIDVARAVSRANWDSPRGIGKWSPAQETKHLILVYAAFVRDLRGEGALRLRGRWWQRRVWRWLGLQRILALGRIPVAVRAPSEVRPPVRPGEHDALLAELTAEVDRFEAVIAELFERQPERRVTHPYFNYLTLEELLRFSAVHTRHHATFVRLALKAG